MLNPNLQDIQQLLLDFLQQVKILLQVISTSFVTWLTGGVVLIALFSLLVMLSSFLIEFISLVIGLALWMSEDLSF